MRILHLGKFYPPDPGGLEHIVASLAEGAAAAGHEVSVVCATGSSWKTRETRTSTELPAKRGLTVIRLPTPTVVWSQPIVPGYLWASRRPADIVYLHRPHPLADLAAWIWRPRGLIIFHHSDVQRQKSIRAAYRPLAHAVARRARATVVGAAANLNFADDLGPEGKAKAHVIPLGVDEGRFREKSHGAPEPFTRLPSPVGVFVGRLVSYKGLDVLVRAVKDTDLRVVIVGDGPMRDELQAQVKELGVSGQVVLTGSVSDEELPAYHQAADYFVLPSTTPAEMFGVTMLEAMACGKPVVSTSVPSGMLDVNINEVTGLVVAPGDHLALRSAMERLASDSSIRARLGAGGRKRVDERFTLSKMVSAHLDLCEAIRKGDS